MEYTTYPSYEQITKIDTYSSFKVFSGVHIRQTFIDNSSNKPFNISSQLIALNCFNQQFYGVDLVQLNSTVAACRTNDWKINILDVSNPQTPTSIHEFALNTGKGEQGWYPLNGFIIMTFSVQVQIPS